MAIVNRIPELQNYSRKGLRDWFNEMYARDLLFHPDNDPASLVHVDTGKRFFSGKEVKTLREYMAAMFERQGDRVYDVAYPVFMRAFRRLVGV